MITATINQVTFFFFLMLIVNSLKSLTKIHFDQANVNVLDLLKQRES